MQLCLTRHIPSTKCFFIFLPPPPLSYFTRVTHYDATYKGAVDRLTCQHNTNAHTKMSAREQSSGTHGRDERPRDIRKMRLLGIDTILV